MSRPLQILHTVLIAASVCWVGCESRRPETVEWRGHVLHEVFSIDRLPVGVRNRLGVDLPATDGVADRGHAFNVTDVVNPKLPMRRLLTAGEDGPVWLVALERGGRAYYVEAFLFDGDGGPVVGHWSLTGRPNTLKQVVQQLPAGDKP